MNLKFSNKKISGILTVLPGNEVRFEDEIDNYEFSRSQSLKLKLIMGYDRRRVVREGTTVSDLCVFGLNYLFDKNLLDRNEIDALVLVTQSPDYFMPATSHVIHGKLGLKKDMVCMDINQGCSGYPIGLMQAFALLEQDTIRKVVLLNGDTLSTKVSINDRSSRPLTGDGASITIVEKSDTENEIFGAIMTDGGGYASLIIPAGGFKTPSDDKTRALEKDDSGNSRSMEHMYMKGDEVFNFVQKEVPEMIDQLLAYSGIRKDEIDHYLFHQPNKFMLKKLASKMGVDEVKMPNNVVENYGNAGGVTVPIAITHNFCNELTKKSYTVCIAGFGAGLSWSSLIMPLGNLNFCSSVNYN
jgi:3-oxoacyl-[acyl-carrier-protein] synthase-3